MPQPDEGGKYPMRSDVEITVLIVRGSEVVDERPWNDLIGVGEPVALADGSSLNEEDQDTLDHDGWGILRRYGLFPTQFAP